MAIIWRSFGERPPPCIVSSLLGILRRQKLVNPVNFVNGKTICGLRRRLSRKELRHASQDHSGQYDDPRYRYGQLCNTRSCRTSPLQFLRKIGILPTTAMPRTSLLSSCLAVMKFYGQTIACKAVLARSTIQII